LEAVADVARDLEPGGPSIPRNVRAAAAAEQFEQRVQVQRLDQMLIEARLLRTMEDLIVAVPGYRDQDDVLEIRMPA
jgi:hypothetical protein